MKFLYKSTEVRMFYLNASIFLDCFASVIVLQDPQVDCYKTSRVQTELCLSRENLVGLAIFLGCDYIPKVGNRKYCCIHTTHIYGLYFNYRYIFMFL